MPTAFVKLYGSILHSSIWLEPHPTRIVWITMLAMADENGVVSASVGGLAHTANVSRDECKAALESFMAPDEDSRTPDCEGRRVAKTDGGWIVLNHAKYREKRTTKQTQAAERQHRFRERKKLLAGDSDDSLRDVDAVTTDKEEDRDQEEDVDLLVVNGGQQPLLSEDDAPNLSGEKALTALWAEGEEIRSAISKGPKRRGFAPDYEKKLKSILKHIQTREECSVAETQDFLRDHWRRVVEAFDGDLRKADNFWMSTNSFDFTREKHEPGSKAKSDPSTGHYVHTGLEKYAGGEVKV